MWVSGPIPLASATRYVMTSDFDFRLPQLIVEYAIMETWVNDEVLRTLESPTITWAGWWMKWSAFM